MAGQLQIVYNLIAQRNDKENLCMAVISTNIAAARVQGLRRRAAVKEKDGEMGVESNGTIPRRRPRSRR
jgi:hypothetical protein